MASREHYWEKDNNLFSPISEKELELGDCIGSGSFGQVYKAKYKNKLVAVKYVSLTKKKEFEAELRALCAVNHPNVIRLYGANIAPPKFFLVMELGSTSLHNYIRENEYEMMDVYKWSIQIAEGMGYLHAKNILHRDLKTANILLDNRKFVKICDFGTSKRFEMTDIMTFAGTISYMAPELLKQQPSSEKVDVYSFAIVLWEMITGKSPFPDLKPFQVMWIVAGEGKRLPIPDDCPELFRQIIDLAWKQDPKDRPSFKLILGKLMASIGTDLQIRSDSGKIRPLRVQQADWETTIDRTIEAFKTIQIQTPDLLAAKKLQLDQQELELAQKQKQLEFEKKLQMLHQQEAESQKNEEESEPETTGEIIGIRRFKSCPAPRKGRGKEAPSRWSLAKATGQNHDQSPNANSSGLNVNTNMDEISPIKSPLSTIKSAHIRQPSSDSTETNEFEGYQARDLDNSGVYHSRDISTDSTDQIITPYTPHSREPSIDLDQQTAVEAAATTNGIVLEVSDH